tara:strand:- start:231 stop:425 length:195 start_codon:yes stop_codon:yes gene_type:complete
LEGFDRLSLLRARFEEDLDVKGLGLRVAGRSGRAGSVAIVELDPFEECLAGCGGHDRFGFARHG